MPTLYPGAADNNTSLPNPGANDSTENSNPLLDHDYQHATANDAIKAIQAKLGVGAGTPGANGQLLCVVNGATVWQFYTVGGDLSGSLPNPTLINIPGVAGSYGSNTRVPVITVDTKGRVTSASDVAVAGGGGGAASPLTTKGDIWVYSTADTRLPVGTNGQILAADSTTLTGVKWIAAPNSAVWGAITGTLASQTDLQAALDGKLSLSGGTLTGALVLAADPVAALGAATKQYVDNGLAGKVTANAAITAGTFTKITFDAKGLVTGGVAATTSDIAEGANLYYTEVRVSANSTVSGALQRSGGTMTGALTLSGDPTAALHSATKQYVDALGSTSLIRNQIPTGLINGSNTAYTTASTFATGSLKVYLNGQRLNPGSGNDYVEVTQGFTMQYAPATGDILLVDYETTNTAFIQGSNSIVVQETPTGLVNSSNTAFTTQLGKYVANTLEVFVNGVAQKRTTDYTETSPAAGTFTFAAAPTTGQFVRVNYQFSTGASGNADTVDGFHASASPTAGNLLPLNTRGQSGEWWEELGRTTLTVAGNTVSVASLPTKKYLLLLADLVPSGAIAPWVRFNNDAANNYSFRYAVSYGAGANIVSTDGVSIDTSSSAVRTVGELLVENVAAAEKQIFGQSVSPGTAGAANIGALLDVFGKWANTSTTISQVDIVNRGGAGTFGIGSELIVLGHD